MNRALDLLAQLRAQGVVPQGIVADSRRVCEGDVFVAWPGYATDGRQHISAAIKKGASAVLWENGDGFDVGCLPVPALSVKGLRDEAGYLADEIYHRPSGKLWLVGVTGTNGKTTVSQWLARTLTELGTKCGIVGTMGWGFPESLEASANTTPDALTFHRVLADFVNQDAQAAAVEVSSIGLDQGRVNGAHFDLAIFTNLTRDHLDYHGTMDAYASAKAKLFFLSEKTQALINFDDAFGLALARKLVKAGMPVMGYTQIKSNALAVPGAQVLVADRIATFEAGLRFSVLWQNETTDVLAQMIAPFNVSNLLAVIGALLIRGFPLQEIIPVVERLTPPQGRMQLTGGIGEPLVVIDYAHTPDALKKVLEAVRVTAQARQGRLWCVFGCGGGRDSGKRPLMGQVVSELADHIVITSDNPRGEEPKEIIDAIAGGAVAGAEQIIDRAEAIQSVILRAGVNDVVVIAGKGHEAYQEVRGVKLPFSDMEQAKTALAGWNNGRQQP